MISLQYGSLVPRPPSPLPYYNAGGKKREKKGFVCIYYSHIILGEGEGGLGIDEANNMGCHLGRDLDSLVPRLVFFLIRGRGKKQSLVYTVCACVRFSPKMGKPDIFLGNVRNTKQSRSHFPDSAPLSLLLWWATAAFCSW